MKNSRKSLLLPLLVVQVLAVQNPVAVAPALAQPEVPSWKWTDFEVVGQRTLTREQILKSPPIEIGSSYQLDVEAVRKWCDELEERLDLHEARCSPVRFVDGKAFLVIDVVEKGDERRARFRAAPEGDVELATPEARKLDDQLVRRQRILFGRGEAPAESAEKGYLDYDDADMHGIVEKLRKLLPPHRDNLLDVIARDKDAEDRGAAARMLNWAGDVTGSIGRVYPYVDDPSVLVRNNVSRFMLHYVGEVESAEVRRAVAGELAKMLDRPSHADRNKAVYGLLNMVKSRPEDREYVLEAAGENLERLAGQSVLMNVRDPAKELLGILRGEAGQLTGQEGGEVADPLAKMVDGARSDLAERLSIGEDEVEVVRAERVTWRDSSLGCPKPGTMYMQMLTPGVLIELEAGGKLYPYHSNREGPAFYCEKPSSAGPLPAEEE